MARLFLLLGRSRTGSNMLMFLLRQHPEVACAGEIFRRVEPGAWRDTLDELRAKPTAWSGFKMFYYHGKGDAEALWGYLEEERPLPVIHLRRRNQLHVAVSHARAMENRRWLARDATTESIGAVTLDRFKLQRNFAKVRAYEEEFTERFRGHPVVDIEYEDLAADPAGQLKRVTDLLDLEPLESVSMVTQKQTRGSVPELVANYDELKAHFAGSSWASYFED